MIAYLASPFSSPDPAIRHERFRQACRATARLLREGHVVFSPVVNSYPLIVHGNAESDHATWMKIDKAMFEVCDELWVLTLPGWEDSAGVTAELAWAKWDGKPIKFVEVQP